MLGQFLCAGGLAQDPGAVFCDGVMLRTPEQFYDVLPRTDAPKCETEKEKKSTIVPYQALPHSSPSLLQVCLLQ